MLLVKPESTWRHDFLVYGFDPFEKYARQIGSFPQVGMKIKNLWNHQPVLVFAAGFPLQNCCWLGTFNFSGVRLMFLSIAGWLPCLSHILEIKHMAEWNHTAVRNIPLASLEADARTRRTPTWQDSKSWHGIHLKKIFEFICNDTTTDANCTLHVKAYNIYHQPDTSNKTNNPQFLNNQWMLLPTSMKAEPTKEHQLHWPMKQAHPQITNSKAVFWVSLEPWV